jgi:hypothetical protein
VIGLLVGLGVTYGVAILWNPSSYESTLPLLLAGVVAGPLAGIMVARRTGRTTP